LNWHLFKAGIRLPAVLEEYASTPSKCIETFFDSYSKYCKSNSEMDVAILTQFIALNPPKEEHTGDKLEECEDSVSDD
jgi:hypothetical protein